LTKRYWKQGATTILGNVDVGRSWGYLYIDMEKLVTRLIADDFSFSPHSFFPEQFATVLLWFYLCHLLE
jgi:hypothetical protein